MWEHILGHPRLHGRENVPSQHPFSLLGKHGESYWKTVDSTTILLCPYLDKNCRSSFVLIRVVEFSLVLLQNLCVAKTSLISVLLISVIVDSKFLVFA